MRRDSQRGWRCADYWLARRRAAERPLSNDALRTCACCAGVSALLTSARTFRGNWKVGDVATATAAAMTDAPSAINRAKSGLELADKVANEPTPPPPAAMPTNRHMISTSDLEANRPSPSTAFVLSVPLTGTAIYEYDREGGSLQTTFLAVSGTECRVVATKTQMGVLFDH